MLASQSAKRNACKCASPFSVTSFLTLNHSYTTFVCDRELFVTENMVRKDGEPSVSYAKLMTHGFKHGIVKKLQTDAQQGLDA